MGLLVLTAVLWNKPGVQAAMQVDMQQKGELTLTLGADSAQMGRDMARIKGADGARGELTVRAWKLADMLETGQYEFTESFRDLPGEDGDWREMSEAALAAVYELDEEKKPVGEPKISPAYSGTVHVTEAGVIEKRPFSGMDLGLYLILVDQADSPKYEYAFTPMIVSLPWSEYQYVGGNGSDTWQYEREAVLKPARKPRYGSIRITKALTEYNVSQGDVTFVFDVVARESLDPDSEIVYSNVVSLTFSETGTKEVILDHIPAEAVVTVTEIYSGANCEVTVSDDGKKPVTAEGEEGNPVTFSFENAYDEDRKSGYGIENRFRYDTEHNTYRWTTDRPEVGGGTEDQGDPQVGE